MSKKKITKEFLRKPTDFSRGMNQYFSFANISSILILNKYFLILLDFCQITDIY